MGDGRSVENISTNVYAKFRCAPRRIKKALGIFGPLEQHEEQLEFSILGPAFRVQKTSAR